MATTDFSNGTVVQADWLNDVNDLVYEFTQAGTGAVARTAQDKMRDVVSVLDFGAVADGSFVAGGSASGTDNLSAINLALAYCAVAGADLEFPRGQFYFSAGFVIPSGVTIRGEGSQFVPFYLSAVLPKTGTTLLVNGQTGADCVRVQENGFNSYIENCNIFNTNTNAIRSVLRFAGQLYCGAKRVCVNSLRPTTGAGLLLETADVGGVFYETLYSDFEHIECTVYNPGLSTEASCRVGVKVVSRSVGKRVNAARFFGGSFSGKRYAYEFTSLVAGTGALNLAFFGTLFEGNYSASEMVHEFVANSQKLINYISTNSYIVRHGLMQDCEDASFVGCYFEMGNVPSTYNDGANGVAPLVAAIYLDNPTGCKRTTFVGGSFNACYLYDNGFVTQVSPMGGNGGYRYDNTRATSLTVRTNATQTITPYGWVRVGFNSSPFRGGDNFLVWDSANNQAIIRSPGTYLVTANITFGTGWTTSDSYARCRVVVGGNQFEGAYGKPAAATSPISTSISVAVDRDVGDSIYLEVFQNTPSDQTLTATSTQTWMTITKIA
jgi:hypothetical protein